MKKFCIVLIIAALLVSPDFVFGQYLPVGFMPMEYNTSFAGSAGNSRIVTNILFSHYYNDEEKKQTNFGFYSSYDQFIPKLRSGIGFETSWIHSSNNDNYGNNDRTTLNISATLAPKLSIKGKYTISPSLRFGYNNYSWQYQMTHYNSKGSSGGFTTMAGILFNGSNYYIGYAAKVLEFQNNRWYDMSDELYSAFQFGYSFQKSADSKFSFTPQLVFPLLGAVNSIQLVWPAYNLSFRHNRFLFGFSNQFNFLYPVGIQLGWQQKGWRFMLSNQFKGAYYSNTNSKIDYTANLSLRYIFNRDKKSIHIWNEY